jgi:CPA1 family monovalent cation:H+ antiporter
LIQGLTLRPLVQWLHLPRDDTVQDELGSARAAALKGALGALEGDHSPAAESLRRQYAEALSKANAGSDPHEGSDYTVRRRVLPAARQAIDDLRQDGTIGDEAFQRIQEELDWLELSSTPIHSAQD